MSTTPKSSALFGALGTRLRTELARDPFLGARLRTAFLYFFSGAVVLVVMDYFVDSQIRDAMYTLAVDETGHPIPSVAFSHVQTLLWISRVGKLMIYAVVVYVITGYTLRYLKRSAEIQKRFVALASHELRTPLAVIKNAAEVTLRRKETLPRERLEEILEANLNEINRLADTVQFLMDYSDVSGKRQAMRLVLVDLSTVVHATCRDFDDIVHGADLSYSYEIEPGIRIRGNATALRILLSNVLRNCIKYTKVSGSIRVQLVRQEQMAILSVSDTGIGIPKKDVSHVFDPFYRSAKLDTTTGSGMGLGLSIVRDVVGIHGGSIDITSEVGAGTAIRIALPLLT